MTPTPTAQLSGTAGGSILDEMAQVYPEAAAPEPPPPADHFNRPTPEMAPPFGDEPMDGLTEGEPDADSVFEDAFSEGPGPVRGNPMFYFPGSRQLDRWLPTALAALCVTWLAYMSLGSGVGEPPWVGAVRFLLILLTYTGVVYPICLAGVRRRCAN